MDNDFNDVIIEAIPKEIAESMKRGRSKMFFVFFYLVYVFTFKSLQNLNVTPPIWL